MGAQLVPTLQEGKTLKVVPSIVSAPAFPRLQWWTLTPLPCMHARTTDSGQAGGGRERGKEAMRARARCRSGQRRLERRKTAEELLLYDEGGHERGSEGGREGSPIVETGEGERGRALQWLLAAHGNERQNR